MTVHNRLGPPLRATFGADLPPFPPPRHMRRRPVRRLVAVGTAMAATFAALMFAACSMAPRQSPDSNTVSPCAEVDSPPEGCE